MFTVKIEIENIQVTSKTIESRMKQIHDRLIVQNLEWFFDDDEITRIIKLITGCNHDPLEPRTRLFRGRIDNRLPCHFSYNSMRKPAQSLSAYHAASVAFSHQILCEHFLVLICKLCIGVNQSTEFSMISLPEQISALTVCNSYKHIQNVHLKLRKSQNKCELWP